MVHALTISGVVPSKMFFTFNEYSHCLNPEGVCYCFQAPGQGILHVSEVVTAFEGVTAIAWRAGNLAQFCACNTCDGWQVIRALRHFAWCAQASCYLTCFFFLHGPRLSYSLSIVNPSSVLCLNPDSLWAGPPAWALEPLFFCFISSRNFLHFLT